MTPGHQRHTAPLSFGGGPPPKPGATPPQTPCCLHLFSGDASRPDGIAAYLREAGWDTRDVDIVNASSDPQGSAAHDLSSDALWTELFESVAAGAFRCVFMGTPCETFSRARTGPPGPRPLRTAQSPYGLPRGSLTEREFEQVRLGTYFALQSCRMAQAAIRAGVPWGLENPEPMGNPVSLFALPEFQDLAESRDVRVSDFDQCHLGAGSKKPTRVLSWGLDLRALEGRRPHPPHSAGVGREAGGEGVWGGPPPPTDRQGLIGGIQNQGGGSIPGEHEPGPGSRHRNLVPLGDTGSVTSGSLGS